MFLIQLHKVPQSLCKVTRRKNFRTQRDLIKGENIKTYEGGVGR
jgi:hypothetical protein